MKKPLAKIVCGLALLLAPALTTSNEAGAHGERAQEPFLRMRTVNWFDIAWSNTMVDVNGTMEVTGKLRMAPKWSWPGHQPPPDTAFLNIAAAGPVFTREAAYISGRAFMNSGSFKQGETYTFRIVLKGRVPGRWHIHPMMNVQGVGPIIGPGKYIQIKGDQAHFKNEVKTLLGQTIDLETYGLGNIIFWHGLWAIIAFAWLGFWLVRPLFFSRFRMVEAGRGNELISRFDKLVSLLLLAGAIGLTFVGYFRSEARWPITLPLQVARPDIRPINLPANEAAVELLRATYRIPGRAMKMKYRIKNNSSEDIRIGEFNTAGIRFLNPEVGIMDDTTKDYPANLIAKSGLTVDDNTPIQPGEIRVVEMIAKDAVWEVERLSSLIYDPDSNYGGMLFFYGSSGKRYISDVGGAVVPQFR